MSTVQYPAADHVGHAEHGHHGHHVTSMKMLIGIFVTLVILTVLTVYTAKYIDLGATGNFILAMFIATLKASLVAAFFMHLVHDNKFNAVVLLYCLLALVLFLLFTIIDLESRSMIDPRREGDIKEPPMVAEHKADKAHGEGESGGGGDH